jgi:hypothetical protein
MMPRRDLFESLSITLLFSSREVQMDDRMITTTMSSRIVSGLMKKGWTIRRLARTLNADSRFVEGVKAKQHVLTMNDINALAQAAGKSVNMMILDSLEPVKPKFRRLIGSVRDLIEVSEAPIPQEQRKPSKTRRSRTKAA